MTINRSNLSLREKIGQTVNVSVGSHEIRTALEECGGEKGFLERYPVGSIFLGSDVLIEGQEASETIRATIERFSVASKIPILASGDFERGCGDGIRDKTILPHLMTLGATRSPELAYELGRTIGGDVSELGFKWVFNPVADLNMNPLNEVTTHRSISDDPAIALPLLCEIVRGIQESGVAACIKHFPGDGVDWRNQHQMATCNSLDRQAWMDSFGAVYHKLFDADVMSVMLGHITCPAFQQERFDERLLPATLSQELAVGLLRDRLGFRGVALTDALIMGGFLEFHEGFAESSVQSLRSGSDVLLWPPLAFFNACERAVEEGRLDESRIDEAVDRVLTMKHRLGLLGNHRDDHATTGRRTPANDLGRRIAEAGVTLVRDRTGLLPLDTGDNRRILVVTITTHESFHETLKVFCDGLRTHGFEVVHRTGIWINELEDIEKDFDVIIYAVQTKMGMVHIPCDVPCGHSIWTAGCFGRSRSVMVSFGSPYMCTSHFASCPVAINAYSTSDDCQKAAVSAICGDIPFRGISPVNHIGETIAL